MTVELVTTSSPEIVEAMERLIPQLSRSAPALTAEQCEAANRLYRRAGFELRETNVYRYAQV